MYNTKKESNISLVFLTGCIKIWRDQRNFTNYLEFFVFVFAKAQTLYRSDFPPPTSALYLLLHAPILWTEVYPLPSNESWGTGLRIPTSSRGAVLLLNLTSALPNQGSKQKYNAPMVNRVFTFLFTISMIVMCNIKECQYQVYGWGWVAGWLDRRWLSGGCGVGTAESWYCHHPPRRNSPSHYCDATPGKIDTISA